jgi:hypothetical protein
MPTMNFGGNFGIQPLNLQGVLGLNLGGLFSLKGIGLDDIKVNNLPLIRLDTIKLDPIKLGITEIPKITIDVGLDNIRIKELPKVELEIGLKPIRVHVPTHYQMCFSVLGKEMFKLALCGETMVATEPYLPHQAEKCA